MSYYLLEHQNRNAPKRADGRRGWFYPARYDSIRLVVMHIPVAPYVESGPDSTAERIAAFFANTDRSASAHVMIDADSVVPLMPDNYTAFHVRGFNSESLGVEHGWGHLDWGRNPEREEQCLRLTAQWLAPRVKRYGIPLKQLTKAEAEAGKKGFVAHSVLDPARRKDPGPNYPWKTLFRLIEQENGNMTYEDIGAQEGVDPVLSTTWEWLQDQGIFTQHTDPDALVSAERLGAFLYRYHARVVLPEIAEAVQAAGNVNKDAVARSLAEKALAQLQAIGEAVK
jgi:hypothetical protein